MSQTEFVTRLKDILDASEIQTDPDEIAYACTDWRRRYHTSALAIIIPKSIEALCKAVSLCHEHNIAMTTQGGNTGLVGGAVPALSEEKHPHVVIKTNLIKGSIDIDPANLTLTAGAGYTLQEIQEAADKAGFLFPLSLASEGTCTIGGNLASNAGGVAVLRYGNTRELCLGLEFVSAQGALLGDLRGLRKNNTGYDLRHLLIGSEGTLGIITRACLKIYPRPTAKVVAWLNVDSMQAAVGLLQAIQSKMFAEISSYEWMNHLAIDLVQQHFPVKAPGFEDYPGCDHVLVEFTSLQSQVELQDKVEQVLSDLYEAEENNPVGLLNIFVAQSLAENAAFWAVRENISEAQAKEGLNIKHDIACAVSRLPEFHAKATSALEATGVEMRPILFGHLGDGNLHYNLSGPANTDNKGFLADYQHLLNRIVHEKIQEVGGTVSAEHGIGQLKALLLKEITPKAQYETMQAIKQAMDPKGLLNPGKMLLS